MKKLFLSFLLLGTCAIVANAQRVYFCANYTDSGDPVSPGALWNINPSGGFVYVLFQSGGPEIKSDVIFHVNKLSGNDYVPFDVKTVTPVAGKNWALLDYKFLSEGNYSFIVKDGAGKELAKEFVTIKVNSTSTTTGTADNYSSSSVKAGTAVDESTGYITGEGNSFEINKEGGFVCFKVSNAPKTLGTTKLIVDVFKMNASGAYDFFETVNFNISDLDWTYFKYTFYSPGTYKIKVYNANSAWINDCIVTISQK